MDAARAVVRDADVWLKGRGDFYEGAVAFQQLDKQSDQPGAFVGDGDMLQPQHVEQLNGNILLAAGYQHVVASGAERADAVFKKMRVGGMHHVE